VFCSHSSNFDNAITWQHQISGIGQMCARDLLNSMHNRQKQLHTKFHLSQMDTHLDLDHFDFQFPVRAVIQIVLVTHLIVTFIHLIALIQNLLDEFIDRFPACMRVLLQSLAGVAVLSELLWSASSAELRGCSTQLSDVKLVRYK
jgi:hypothetical protein